MSELNVRIVRLEPMRVAWALGFGKQPESLAWKAIFDWIKAQGMEGDLQSHRFLGFNNPSPTPASPNYGYEQWMTVDETAQPSGEVGIKEFGGGLYAVTHCKLPQIYQTWQALAAWREDSPYRPAQHQWLEECLNPSFDMDEEQLEFDIYLPIAK
jgi:DNA gyrase inhibitor GyrI